MHCVRAAASRTFCTAGKSRPISTAMIAITTSSSISVKAGLRRDGRTEHMTGPPYRIEDDRVKSEQPAGWTRSFQLDVERRRVLRRWETPDPIARGRATSEGQKPHLRPREFGLSFPDRLRAASLPGAGSGLLTVDFHRAQGRRSLPDN